MNGQRYADSFDGAGRYLLESRIATGGMGEVWRGRDTVLDRPVAVKVLKAEYADDTLFRTRFETEARHAGSLHHPGIASVFDFGEAAPTDGSTTPRPFLVMELVDGQPLSALLRPGSPMDPAVTRDLLGQAATALGAAHAAGIVHRDVKPGNLIITPDRRVKVTDFGIARAAEGMPLTQTGQVMGTPQYLSPEQAEGKPVSPASDVYSLGVVAYECLAGRRPFTAESPVATALAHVRQPVPELPDHVPADLAAVVHRSLAKDPAERYADGSAFAAALRDPAGPAAAVGGAAATVPAAGSVVDAPPATRVLAGATAAGGAATGSRGDTVGDRPPERRRTAGRTPWWTWLLLLLVLLLGAVLLVQALADDPAEQAAPRQERTSPPASEPTGEPTTQPTEDTTSQPPPEEQPTEEPGTVVVDEDDYLGRDHQDVEKELKELGLKPKSEQVDNDGTHEEGTVAGIEPSGELEEGTEVTVFYYGKPPEDEDGNEGPGSGEGPPEGQGNGNSGEGSG